MYVINKRNKNEPNKWTQLYVLIKIYVYKYIYLHMIKLLLTKGADAMLGLKIW